ncbi:hypothetical protein DOY81_005658 [Sarcophaga bullata]|nr:hypothetical protein DOY81_005658 [Sarcophaga bullata]
MLRYREKENKKQKRKTSQSTMKIKQESIRTTFLNSAIWSQNTSSRH